MILIILKVIIILLLVNLLLLVFLLTIGFISPNSKSIQIIFEEIYRHCFIATFNFYTLKNNYIILRNILKL